MDFWATEYTKLAMPVLQDGRTSIPGALGAGAFGGVAGAGGFMAARHALGQPAMSQGFADQLYNAPGQAADAVSGAAHSGANALRSMFTPDAPKLIHGPVSHEVVQDLAPTGAIDPSAVSSFDIDALREALAASAG